MEYRISPDDRARFKRCRRQWDFASPHRRGLEPVDVTPPAVPAALKDALAVYYYPGTWDWPHELKQSLVHKAAKRSLDEADAAHGLPTAAALLDTYVGNRAGERILAGQIRRGHAETMQAAIWLSDLRGFTALSDRLQPEIVVDILNQYFDCQVPAIRKCGGEILKFMGDGLLAVFPIAKDGSNLGEVCARVLEAAREARANVDAMRYPGEESNERFRFGVALHIGGILFGNIGGMSRLDFTCIGPAVNLAARLEKIAGRLKRTVVASAAFAGVMSDGWADLGEFPIAGFSAAQRVFGLRDEAAF
jgi:adenylate cyclase